MKSLFLVLVLLLVPTLGGCGDDDSTSIDAAIPPDATVDAVGAPDATVVTRCEAMCACAVANCTGFDTTSCIDNCNTLATSTQACRLEHCGYAKSNPTFHCPHVKGEDLPGTPDACVPR